MNSPWTPIFFLMTGLGQTCASPAPSSEHHGGAPSYKNSATRKVALLIGRFTYRLQVDTAVRKKKDGVQGNSFPWPAPVLPLNYPATIRSAAQTVSTWASLSSGKIGRLSTSRLAASVSAHPAGPTGVRPT